MAAPHVAGAAALLLQHHPGWTAGQVKSALVSTAATAWADTARTVEAPVLTAGSGLINVVAANDPKLFTDPVSLSYRGPERDRGAVSKSLLLAVADAGDGAGTWTVEVKPQANPSGVQIIVPGTLTIAPGGDLQVPVTARAAADAGLGEAYGFLLLRRGDVVRKVAYAMLVTRPGLEQAPILQLRQAQTGDTRKGVSHASAYRYPAAAFGPAANYVGTPVNEDGAETLYRIRIDEPAVNVGAAVIFSTPGSLVHPWLLGSPDENDVQGYAGTPVNVNNLTLDFPLDIGAAATVFPRTKAYYVAVDSGRDQFTGRSLGGAVPPPGLGERRAAAAPRSDHEPRRGRPADARASRARSRRRGRPVLARDRLRPGARRRRRVRPGQRHRDLPAAAGGAGSAHGATPALSFRRGLPGSEERGLGRR